MTERKEDTTTTTTTTTKLRSGEEEKTAGETHQTAQEGQSVLTTQEGMPISDNQNALKTNPRGGVLLEDQLLREKIFHFDHERIPERVVHARGYGVHGFFENYESLAEITSANLFQKSGEKTPVFVRFSTVIGNKGSFDLARDVRGFAVKFYTKEGNWDLVGNNMPVFFIQDGIKFPDLIHAAKQEPDRAFPQAATAHDNLWDFISLMPESMHMIMWAMSDRAIPRSYRFMEGFGVNTYRFVNSKQVSKFVKFHWKPKLGLQSVVWNEAVKINGADPDFHRRDLWDAIQNGSFPEWELALQIFDEEFAQKCIEEYGFDILDCTKLIPEEILPVRKVGRLVLNRTVDNFFAETEQVAFCTHNVIPGIDFSDDPLLQARNFSYLDTQLKRLGGPNFTQLPINAPKCPFANFNQDGHMTFFNPKGRVNYEPNSWGMIKDIPNPRETPHGFRSYPAPIAGKKVRARSETFSDHYSQARLFYISQTEIEQKHIADAFIFELSCVGNSTIRVRMVSHLLNIDKQLAQTVATGLGIKEMPKAPVPAKPTREHLDKSPSLSIVLNGPKSFGGRKLGIFLTDGADADMLADFKKIADANQVMIEIVAPTIGGVTMNDTKTVEAHHKIEGGPSVLFDAVVLIFGNSEDTQLLLKESTAKDFVSDAFAHMKYIAYTATALPLIEKAGVVPDEACMMIKKGSDITTFFEACKNLRYWPREATVNAL